MKKNSPTQPGSYFANVAHGLIMPADRSPQSCHASTVAVLPDGSLFAAWFAGSKEGADDVKIWGAGNRNGIWEPPRILADAADLPHWNPVLFVPGAGMVILFYKVGRMIAAWQTWQIVSLDCGRSWSVPTEMVAGDTGGGRGPVRNKLIQLANGRWLAPASNEQGVWRAFVDYSDDQGRTWQKSREIFADLGQPGEINPDFGSIAVSEQSFAGRGVIQPTLWADGEQQVHMLLRSSERRIFRSDSIDNGTHWTAAYPTSLPNNNSGIDLVHVVGGRLFLVYNPVGINWGPRTPLSLVVSEDNGATWDDVMTLEDHPGEYSYPAIIANGQELLITYTFNRKNIAFWQLELRGE